MFKRILCVLAAVSMLILSACAKNTKEDATLSMALENIEEPLRLMDERFSIYGSALNSARAYTGDPSEKTLREAIAACAGAIEKITALPTAVLGLSEADLQSMVNIGINTADYRVPFEYENYYKNECVQTLSQILYYLEEAPALDDSLRSIVDFNISFQAASRQIEMFGLNELFCTLTGKEIDRFKNDFLPTLTALNADGLPWDTDSASIEAKVDKLFADMEAETNDYMAFWGEQYLSYLEARRDLKDMLLDAGYGEAEADKIASDAEALAKQAE